MEKAISQQIYLSVVRLFSRTDGPFTQLQLTLGRIFPLSSYIPV